MAPKTQHDVVYTEPHSTSKLVKHSKDLEGAYCRVLAVIGFHLGHHSNFQSFVFSSKSVYPGYEYEGMALPWDPRFGCIVTSGCGFEGL